jgi:hypothetical protein
VSVCERECVYVHVLVLEFALGGEDTEKAEKLIAFLFWGEGE